MDKRTSLVLALVITGVFPVITLNALQNRPAEYTEQGAIDAALYYLKNSPTFKYDGILDSINVTGAYRARTPTPTWLVAIRFDCLHSGYGERDGQMLLQVITPHVIGVIVEEGEVIEATIDGKWDVIAQEPIEEEPPYTEEQAVDIALDFVEACPTFLFDGIDDPLEVVSVDTLRMPWTWEVTIRFQCSQPGYGDRTGMMLAQVITPHEISVVVSEGEVIRAIVDGEWDELKQRETVQSELIPPEYAKDLAIQYILENYHPDVTLPEFWAFETLTPEGLVGASIQQFVGGGWEVNLSFPAVITPIYALSVSYTGETNFTWEGTVDQLCNVRETSTSLKPEILMPEDARDIAVEYVLENMDVLKDVETPSVWLAKVTAPSGIVGFSSRRYTCDGWTVNVSNPVVWKPTYRVEIEYAGESTYSWEGTVDQNGNIEAQ